MKTRSPDLLLLHPGTNKKVYEKLAEDFAAVEPPFAAALTAGFVRDKGYSVELLDANAEKLTAEETAERVLEFNPGLIGIIAHGQQPSASSHLMGAIGDTCKEIKGRTNTPILLRGIHPSSLPERTLREELVDFVARGEGYYTILGLLEGKEKSKIPGLAWLEDDTFQMNKSSPLIKNLDEELSNVAWDLLPIDKYRAHEWHAFSVGIENRQPYASLYTSLGCPFECTFCCINAEFKSAIAENKGNGFFTKRKEAELLSVLDKTKPNIRYWSPDNVMKNIDYLVQEHGIKNIKFIDEMFVFNKKHVEGIADRIIERGYDVNIWAYARIDTVKDRKLLEKIKKAGINWLVLGIESANKDIRHGADKKFGNEDIFKHVQQVEDVGINVLGNYMVGLRHDTHETMQETLDMALELNTPWFNMYATMAYPGAPDYNWAKEKGIALPGDTNVPGSWTAYSHHSYYTLPLATENLPASEVLKFRDKAWNEYFNNESYLSLVKERFGESAVDYIKKMRSHKIKRRILGDEKD
jgi:anaerobic magnesium-protoporphyrin IX monomethyl ester cyclase